MVTKLTQKLAQGVSKVASKIEGVGKETSARVWEGTAPDDTITTMPDGEILVKSLSEEEVQALNSAITDSGYNGPKINFGIDNKRIGELLNMLGGDVDKDVATLLNTIKKKNRKLFQHFKREQKSVEQLAKIAEAMGVDASIHRFLKRKPGQMLPPEDVLAGIIGVIRLGSELEIAANVIRNSADEELIRTTYKQMAQLAAITSNLSASVSGVVSEYGRGMAVVRNIAKLNDFNLTNFTEQLDQFLGDFEANTIDFNTISKADMKLRAEQYLTLPKAGKAAYQKKGFFARNYDRAMEVYVNSLLAGFQTHWVNMVGNGMFQLQTLAETGIASRIGGFRQGVQRMLGQEVDEADRVMAGEAMEEAWGMWSSLGDATTLLARTLIQGESGDFASKIDLKNLRSITATGTDNIATIMENLSKGEFYHSAIDSLGVLARLPGRFLASEDEFFKVITRRRILHKEAFRRASVARNNYIKTKGFGNATQGESFAPDEYFQEVYGSIVNNPSQEILDLMDLGAKEMTFQSDLQGWQLQMQKMASVPFLKPTFVFVKTPTNIINNVFDRTFNVFPVARAIRQGAGREFDQAMAKLATGWGIFGMVFAAASGMYGDKYARINGGGPPTFKGKMREQEMGVQPYSIQIRKPDGNFETISLSRVDPLSGIIAMAADMAQVMVNAPDDPETLVFIQDMFNAGVLTVAEYAGNLPFLQGASDLMSAFMNPQGDTASLLERIQKFGGGQAANIAGNIGGAIEGRMSFGAIGGMNSYLREHYDIPFMGATSFDAMWERLYDPNRSNTMYDAEANGQEYENMPAIMLGWAEAINKMKARKLQFSREMPVKLGYWGQELTQGTGSMWELVNPFSLKEVDYGKVNNELRRLSYSTGKALSFHRRDVMINGEKVRLMPEEFNQYIRYFNAVDENGTLPEEDGYNGITVKEKMMNLMFGDYPVQVNKRSGGRTITQNLYYDELDDEDKFNFLQSITSDFGSYAKDIIIEDTNLSSPRLEELFLNEE